MRTIFILLYLPLAVPKKRVNTIYGSERVIMSLLLSTRVYPSRRTPLGRVCGGGGGGGCGGGDDDDDGGGGGGGDDDGGGDGDGGGGGGSEGQGQGCYRQTDVDALIVPTETQNVLTVGQQK